MISYLLIAGFGALHSLPMAYPGLWILQPASLAGLVWAVHRSGPRRAGFLGWLFGTTWLCSSVWWLFISMHTYGGLEAWLAVLAVFALCAALSGYLALACAAFARWRARSLWADSFYMAALWLAAELARGLIFTGFPWAVSGYAHVDSPLASFLPWVGVYGVGALVTLMVALGVFLLVLPVGVRVRWAAMGLIIVVLMGPWWLPKDFTAPAGEISVALLQNNVPQNEKFQAEALGPQLDWTRERLQSLPVDLVVAPETVVPLLPSDVPPEFWDALAEHYQVPGRHALIGVPLRHPSLGFTNSVIGFSAQSTPGQAGYYRYDKHHLVPFGEFIPLGFHWFTEMMNIPLGDFGRGPLVAPSFKVAATHSEQWVAPNICYEDLFGEELAARFHGERPPTILANVSNIGWFGNTIAVRQHLQISRLRSLELQRPMLRSTNTGATAIIDYQGRVVNQLPPYTQAVLGGLVQGRKGLTPFAWWAGQSGLWPLVALAGLGIALTRRRRP